MFHDDDYRNTAMSFVKLHETPNTEVVHPMASKILQFMMGDSTISVNGDALHQAVRQAAEWAGGVWRMLDYGAFDKAWEREGRRVDKEQYREPDEDALEFHRKCPSFDTDEDKAVGREWAQYISSVPRVQEAVQEFEIPMNAFYFHSRDARHRDNVSAATNGSNNPLWVTYRDICSQVKAGRRDPHDPTHSLIRQHAWDRLLGFTQLAKFVYSDFLSWISTRYLSMKGMSHCQLKTGSARQYDYHHDTRLPTTRRKMTREAAAYPTTRLALPQNAKKKKKTQNRGKAKKGKK